MAPPPAALNVHLQDDNGRQFTSYAEIPNNTADHWSKDKGLRVNIWHCLGLCMVLFMNGYDGSLFNGLQTIPQWTAYFDTDSTKLGFMTMALYLPSVISAPIASAVAEKFGRLPVVWGGCAFTLVGAIVNASSKSLGQYIAGRAIMGFGTYAAVPIAPALLQEIAHPRYRAKIGGFYTCIYYIAALLSALICLGTRYMGNTEYSWRIPCYVQALGPIVTVIMLIGCPESPRWYVKVGQVEKAHQVLAKYHANGDLNDPLVRYEFEEIQQLLSIEEENKQTKYTDFLKTPGNRRRLMVMCAIAVGTNWVGNAIVSYYLSPILTSVGVSKPEQTSGINVGLQVWNLILSTGAALFVDKIGRRPLWLASTAVMLVGMIIVMALSAQFDKTGNAATGIAVIPFLFIFFGGYDIAWTPLPLTYAIEILPYNIRTKGQAIYMVVQAVATSVNTFVNPIALTAIGWKYYGMYVGILVFYLILIYFYFPETKLLTIEEVSVMFDYGRRGDLVMRERAAARQSGQVSEADIGGEDLKQESAISHLEK